jgi:hypothetical protein
MIPDGKLNHYGERYRQMSDWMRRHEITFERFLDRADELIWKHALELSRWNERPIVRCGLPVILN